MLIFSSHTSYVSQHFFFSQAIKALKQYPLLPVKMHFNNFVFFGSQAVIKCWNWVERRFLQGNVVVQRLAVYCVGGKGYSQSPENTGKCKQSEIVIKD
jgi:hypothetical protein